MTRSPDHESLVQLHQAVPSVGSVISFDHRGFGFIRPKPGFGILNVFFHRQRVPTSLQQLIRTGVDVEYSVIEREGKREAAITRVCTTPG